MVSYSSKGKGYSAPKSYGSLGNKQYGASFPGSYKGAVATYESRLTVNYGNGQNMTYEQKLTMPLLPGQGVDYRLNIGMPHQMEKGYNGLENKVEQYARRGDGASLSDAYKYGLNPLSELIKKTEEKKQEGPCRQCGGPANYGSLCLNCLHKN